MQSILDAPMLTNNPMKLFCTRDDTTDVVLPLIEWFPVSIPVSLHHNAALYS
jgi:hypothetical protein